MATLKHKIVGTVRFENLGSGKLRLLDNWESQNIVTVNIPALKGKDVGGGKVSSGNVRWFKGATYQLEQAFKEVEAKGLGHLILSYAGSFVPRMIRGSVSTPSEHTFGTAFDINVPWNGLGQEPAALGEKGSVRALVEIFEKWGFRWGGYFKRKDGMHFEIARLIPRPSSADERPVSKPVAAPVVASKPIPVAPVENKAIWNGHAPLDCVKVGDRVFVPIRELLEQAGHEIDKYNDQLSENGRFYLNSSRKGL